MSIEAPTPAESERIPVTILSGFLGSGKTTVLNHVVSQPELADALVIINEFGEMALDHLLVAHSTENLVMEMSSGCLCCTIRGDLVKTLRDITWRFSRNGQRQFRRVVIETTGLADPVPILRTLMTDPQLASKYCVDGIVATVDMATGTNTLDAHIEAIKQAAVADVLLLTKPDLASDDQRVALLRRLDGINPAAPRWEIRDGEINADKLLNLGLFSSEGKVPDVERWLQEEAYTDHSGHSHGHDHDHEAHHHHDLNKHDDNIRAFCFAVDEPIPETMLALWLDVLMSFIGSKILRVKGVLNVEGIDTPIVVHAVRHICHPPVSLPAWPSDDRRSRLVFITHGVGREVIESTFKTFREVLPQAKEAEV